ncbi:hypothetical protein MASR2M17_20170 [Aminivibrio sp.]
MARAIYRLPRPGPMETTVFRLSEALLDPDGLLDSVEIEGLQLGLDPS